MSYVLVNEQKYILTPAGLAVKPEAATIRIVFEGKLTELSAFEDAEKIEAFDDVDDPICTPLIGYTELDCICLGEGTATISILKPAKQVALAEDVEVLAEAIEELAAIVGGDE